MKYMLIMNAPRDGYDQFMKWPKKLLEANSSFMGAFTKRLAEAGEPVSAEGLAAPTDAILVRTGKNGKPITDGVFPESKEYLARLEDMDPDDTLVLLFMCCHPALTNASAIALTLRAVGGLTTPEIAKAFLVPESTIGQRISRAKQRIRDSGVPFRLPEPAERNERLGSVLHVLYLIFNEGYTASSGTTLHRTDLSNEAIRLTREVHRLMSAQGDVGGLLALMLLTDARRAARTGPHGELIPLDQQDRSRWDRAAIAEGVALASEGLARGSVGEYQLQAAIAALHGEAASAKDTDWAQILALYTVLMRLTDNPVVALNHAIATAEVEGPGAGLALLDPLERDERLRTSHRLDAVRAHLLERIGDRAAAEALYRKAASRTRSLPERDYLHRKAESIGE